VTVFLVRHGRPLIDPSRPAHEWELDPAGFDDIWALRDRLPQGATWFSSPEPKAVGTAQLLTDGDVAVVDGLREMVRESTDWHDDFEAVVRRAFERPDEPAHDGWETLDACRSRVVAAAENILRIYAGDDLVLVGHGTAWTVLAAALIGAAPDLDRWAALGMPDLITLPDPLPSIR
jgi:broad specificity phosphatase PhoE